MFIAANTRWPASNVFEFAAYFEMVRISRNNKCVEAESSHIYCTYVYCWIPYEYKRYSVIVHVRMYVHVYLHIYS